MIRLAENSIRTFSLQSSKGNQLKWKQGEIWYKADYTGYEGLAEYMVSALLEYSNVKKDGFIFYQTEEIGYKQAVYRGCRSKNFLPDGCQIITLERLFESFYGQSLYKSIFMIQGVEERARFLTERAEQMTGLEKFGEYLAQLMTIDALFLNEDRHMHNIAVLQDSAGKYSYCPVFDNGAALLSDTTIDYPMSVDVIDLIPRASAKTLSTDFDEQLDAVENLYGRRMKFSYDEHIISDLLEKEPYYPEEVKIRVRDILLQQRRKYQYLFH